MALKSKVLEREKEVRKYIEKYSEQFELDPNLIRALITQESRFVAEAQSPTGAFGYGQFTFIGGKQVQNIAQMRDDMDDLSKFTKWDAHEPDAGIKAICATLWWLIYVKYKKVEDEVVKLEAALTFYNAGGKAAALVVEHGGHANAKPYLEKLPKMYASQSLKYAPEVTYWYVQWHELLKPEPVEEEIEKPEIVPSQPDAPQHDRRYGALIDAIKLLAKHDEADVIIFTREGLTEITLIVPGEYE